MTRKIRTLLFSTLYPSSVRPLNGIFVETRLRELLRAGSVDARVVAPVPWFYSTNARYGRYAEMARTPPCELHNGIEVVHPRYLLIPKIGMNMAPLLLALGARAAISRIIDDGFDFDVIDAHYYYPDGVAATLLAKWFDKPVVITARGSDINHISSFHIPRAMVRWAARNASASIGVSAALVARLLALEPGAKCVQVMRNGIDLDRFRPAPDSTTRAYLRICGSPVVLTVGGLYEHKGQRIVVEAFARLQRRFPNAQLIVIGDGPDRLAIEARVAELGLPKHVWLVGSVANEDLWRWYGVADVMVLASSREGWPNVLLEAMACGTPVVASAVGGIPEIIQTPYVGRLVETRTASAFETAIIEVLEAQPSRAVIREHAERYSWDETTDAQVSLFAKVAREFAEQDGKCEREI